MSLSRAQLLAALPVDERRRVLTALGEEAVAAMRRDWKFWARPEQLEPPGEWTEWIVDGGRGYGKTRTGAEFMLDRSEQFADIGVKHLGLLIGATVADCRDVMIEGESGLIVCGERRGYKVDYQPSLRRVTIPDLDTTMTTFTAEKPDQLRGPQGHSAWADEPAKWRHIVDREGNSAWSNLLLALRLEGAGTVDYIEDPDAELPEGIQPRLIATTTPKPIKLVREWFDRHTAGDPTLFMTTGSMMENAANLAPRFIAQIIGRYGGTRLGAQEIDGLLLDAVEGALWTPDACEHSRLRHRDQVPDLSRKCVAVDPSGSERGTGDDCGIIVAGVEANPVNPLRRNFYVLDDLTTPERPEVWAKIAVDAYWREDCVCIVAERNFGGLLVQDVIRLTDPNVPVELVSASKGKIARAEPVALLWDQDRGHFVGTFGLLESECCTFVPGEGQPSPNRLDALAWSAHFLLPEIGSPPASQVSLADEQLPTGADAMIRDDPGGFWN